MTEQRIVHASDGASLWTITEGDGPPILMCHGGPGLWDYLGGLSAHLHRNYRVHRWDQRGCGRSGPAADYGIDRAVADVQELHAILGVDEKWIVLGHSWGAYLALLTALAHPETTRALIYVSGNGTPECWRDRGRAIANARETKRMTQASRQRLLELEERTRTWEEEVEFRRLKWSTDFVQRSPPPPELEAMATTPLDINFIVNRALSRAELYPPEQLLDACKNCPVASLFIHGSHDPRPDIGALELSQLLPNSRFEQIEGAGHLPWIEQPDTTIGLITDFIETTVC